MKKITTFAALLFILSTFSIAEGGWWKGNTHTHSNLSTDGRLPPADLAVRYSNQEYDFLVLTDHNTNSDFAQYSSSEFLCITGEELTTYTGRDVIGLGHTDVLAFKPYPEMSYQEMVDRVNAQGALAILAHPVWTDGRVGLGADDIYPIEGLKFMEIRNAGTNENGEAIWDDLLSMGKQIYGVASDDTHFDSQVGKAWVVVRADNLTQSDILSAMDAGDFYSSDGVVLNDYMVTADSMIVDSQHGELIEFIGFQGEILASVAGTYAEYNYTDTELYVRARVTNSLGQHAWTQPVFVSETTADFDGNGRVDGSDFLAWQLGKSHRPQSAQDLALWKAQYGTTSVTQSSTAVPEPFTILLASLGLSVIIICRKR